MRVVRNHHDGLAEFFVEAAEQGEDFGGGLTRLEVDYLMSEEWASSVEDLYWRHTKAGLYASPADERRLAAYLKSKSGAAQGQAARTG